MLLNLCYPQRKTISKNSSLSKIKLGNLGIGTVNMKHQSVSAESPSFGKAWALALEDVCEVLAWFWKIHYSLSVYGAKFQNGKRMFGKESWMKFHLVCLMIFKFCYRRVQTGMGKKGHKINGGIIVGEKENYFGFFSLTRKAKNLCSVSAQHLSICRCVKVYKLEGDNIYLR